MTRKNGMKDVKQVLSREKERGGNDDDGSCIIIKGGRFPASKRWSGSDGKEKVEGKEVKRMEKERMRGERKKRRGK